MQLVALVEAGGVDVEGVAVLHDELAAAQHAGTGTRLVAVLRLDLVDRERQVLVGAVEVLDREGEHLLVGRAEQVVGALAVLEAEDVVAVLGPAAARLEGLLGQQRREEQLLGADGVHLLADDPLDVAQHAQAEGQPRVDAGADPADVAGADEEAVARDLCVRRVLAKGSQEQGRHVQGHRDSSWCGCRRGVARACGCGTSAGYRPPGMRRRPRVLSTSCPDRTGSGHGLDRRVATACSVTLPDAARSNSSGDRDVLVTHTTRCSAT